VGYPRISGARYQWYPCVTKWQETKGSPSPLHAQRRPTTYLPRTPPCPRALDHRHRHGPRGPLRPHGPPPHLRVRQRLPWVSYDPHMTPSSVHTPTPATQKNCATAIPKRQPQCIGAGAKVPSRFSSSSSPDSLAVHSRVDVCPLSQLSFMVSTSTVLCAFFPLGCNSCNTFLRFIWSCINLFIHLFFSFVFQNCITTETHVLRFLEGP